MKIQHFDWSKFNVNISDRERALWKQTPLRHFLAEVNNSIEISPTILINIIKTNRHESFPIFVWYQGVKNINTNAISDHVASSDVFKISLSFIVPTGIEFAGCWHVRWSKGSNSVYSIQRMSSVMRMRVLSCGWSASCATNKEADVRPSHSMKYSHKDGWVEVNNIHNGLLTIYMRLEENRLTLVWYRPITGFTASGIGLKGI